MSTRVIKAVSHQFKVVNEIQRRRLKSLSAARTTSGAERAPRIFVRLPPEATWANSVSTGPGQEASTCTPRLRSSAASATEKLRT